MRAFVGVGFLMVQLLFLGSVQASVGNEGGGGGYADRNGKPLLLKVAQDLAQHLRVMSPRRLKNVPKEWTPARIAKVIENVKIDSSPASLKIQRDGRMKVLDYNRKKGTITALAGFFLQYADVPEGEDAPQNRIDDIKVKLLHEVSHLWGFNEEQAYKFAQKTMFWLKRNVLVGNYRYSKDGEEKYRYFTYTFAYNHLAFMTNSVSYDVDDDGYPKIPAPEAYGMATTAEHTITSDSIVIEHTGLFKFKVISKREADDNAFSDCIIEVDGEKNKANCIIPALGIPIDPDDE